jgi:hypothetical protein
VLRALALGISLLAAAAPAQGAKWRHCPSELGYYGSLIGGLSAPFIHPGRELGIFLTEREARESGPFSTEPDGNTVHVTFASLWGDPIALPPFSAAAVSPTTLFLRFPDTRALLGRPLAGPVALQVTTGGRMTADILPRHLVALPPATNVAALVAGSLEQPALGTMDTRGAIWVPVEFSAYGPMRSRCRCARGRSSAHRLRGRHDGALDALVRGRRAADLSALPHPPQGRPLPRRLPRRRDELLRCARGEPARVPHPRGFGIKVCGVNDAVDLVMKAPGWSRWAKPWSSFGAWMPSSQPLEIVLNGMTVDQGNLGTGGLDAFGEECIGQ